MYEEEFENYEEAERFCNENSGDYTCGCGCGIGNIIEYEIRGNEVWVLTTENYNGLLETEEEVVGIIHSQKTKKNEN